MDPKVTWKTLDQLKDDVVIALSLGGYDGPRAHLGVQVIFKDDTILYDYALDDFNTWSVVCGDEYAVAYKAESAGREFVKVDPWGTSQECSGCGETVRKGLHVRVHRCPHCGLALDRDTNASINVERRGQRLRGGESGKLLDEPRSFLLAR